MPYFSIYLLILPFLRAILKEILTKPVIMVRINKTSAPSEPVFYLTNTGHWPLLYSNLTTKGGIKMEKAVFGMIFFMLALLCAQNQANAHVEQTSLKPPTGEDYLFPGLEEAELASELLNNDSELSLASDLLEKALQCSKRVPSYALVRVKYTAYYGPRKGQGEYAHGSYDKDVFVNGAGKVTAYGTKPRIGIIATDPKIFPKGTKLLLVDPLDGKEKIFVAEDKGGKIKGRHIDIFTGFGREGLRKTRKMHKKGDFLTVKVLYKPPMQQS